LKILDEDTEWTGTSGIAQRGAPGAAAYRRSMQGINLDRRSRRAMRINVGMVVQGARTNSRTSVGGAKRQAAGGREARARLGEARSAVAERHRADDREHSGHSRMLDGKCTSCPIHLTFSGMADK
jgi:hypothetical protein